MVVWWCLFGLCMCEMNGCGLLYWYCVVGVCGLVGVDFVYYLCGDLE